MAAGGASAPGGGEPSMEEGDAKAFWRLMGDREMDSVFERLQEVVSALRQKIKGGTATEEECFQALALVNQANLTAFLPLPNVNNVEEDTQNGEPCLQPSASTETGGSLGESFSLRDIEEGMSPSREGEPDGKAAASPRLPCRPHNCSLECLAERPWSSYERVNPLSLPLLCRFQRRHAKPSLPTTLDVVYKAPCGRSLRNFKEVRDYLLQTECRFLSLDHFSFNTYVQVFRNSPSRKGLVFDFDISKGAEAVPVSFCNEVSNERLPYFKYRKTSWPHGYFLSNPSRVFLDSCSCTDGCRDPTKCACLFLTWRRCSEDSASLGGECSYGYKYNRLDKPISSGVYECNLSCRCDKMLCQNRVVQRGLQVRLQVFNTEKKGWGVRCLDDIDKGTFVCTYAGRRMQRAESRRPEEGSPDAKEGNTENSEGSPASSSGKRKVDFVWSDSEIEFVQASNDSAGRKHRPLPAEAESPSDIIQSCGSKDLNESNKGIKRPQTRMSVIQSRDRQQGISDATSSEEGSESRPSARRRLNVGTRKRGESRLAEPSTFREQANTGPSETDTDDADESLLPSPRLSSEVVGQDDRSISKQFMDLFWTLSAPKGQNRRSGREPVPTEVTEGDKSSLNQLNGEDHCLLDASREGNVGRFLNHSCSPNLFVQSVFAETHNRNFPWVAFFTNRHVKAGTELTWDYDYSPGSMPETEIPCQCGSHKCRKKIL